MRYLMREAVGLSQREIEEEAARQAGITRERLRERGEMVPCECGWFGCLGWRFYSTPAQLLAEEVR